MIINPYLGQPITDYSVDGCATITQFYLISIANRPYRVIYTRYPYSYLKRFIGRIREDNRKKIARLYSKDILGSYYTLVLKSFFPSSFVIQPVYVEFSKVEKEMPLTRTRIREITAILTKHYTAQPTSYLF